MNDLFSLHVRRDGADLDIRAEWDGQKVSETGRFDPTQAYLTAKKQLAERTPGLSITSPDRQRTVAISLGAELFSTLFTGTVLRLFREYRQKHEEPRLALHLDRLLYREPWELLRDSVDAQAGEFLSIVGSIVRFDPDAEASAPETTFFPPASELRCLYVSPKPAATPEREAVPDLEPDRSESVLFDIVSPPTFADFLGIADRTATRPDGFIFYGHGDVKDNVGHLVFVARKGIIPGFKTWDDDLRPGHAVSTALAQKKQLRFSCLLACESAWVGDTHANLPFEDTVVGALMNQTRVGFVVGAQLKLNFTAAAHFLSGTLSALVKERKPLDLAIRGGRKAVKSLAGAEVGIQAPLDWWVPVLYAKSTGFDVLVPSSAIPLPELTRAF